MGRAVRNIAVPLVLLWILVHLLVGLLVASEFERVAYLGNRAVRWTASFVLTDLLLLFLVSPLLGRIFRRAAAAYGVPSPHEAEEETANRRAGVPALLDRRDPEASVLVTGHTHEPGLVRFPDGRVGVDAGCWVRGLVPVPARYGLPPVFVPAYPVHWVDVQAAPHGVVVALWSRRLAVERRRLEALEWLAATRPLPSAEAEPPRVVEEVVIAPRPVAAPWPAPAPLPGPALSPAPDPGSPGARAGS